MQLKSNAFADGAAVPQRFTCEGDDTSPPLTWSEAPTGTRSFALICDDPDAPGGTWYHWAAYDISEARAALPEGAGRRDAKDLAQAVNDFDTARPRRPHDPKGPLCPPICGAWRVHAPPSGDTQAKQSRTNASCRP